jgi:hypothetical protein
MMVLIRRTRHCLALVVIGTEPPPPPSVVPDDDDQDDHQQHYEMTMYCQETTVSVH